MAQVNDPLPFDIEGLNIEIDLMRSISINYQQLQQSLLMAVTFNLVIIMRAVI
ncbi:MAG: hypothetical protein Ct9H90mP13_02050 [Pseudomonadota bacterium]|nr:MAG: hypothetical protein Ct9H90mP13_02050 [Pseudomonadota bacterium]